MGRKGQNQNWHWNLQLTRQQIQTNTYDRLFADLAETLAVEGQDLPLKPGEPSHDINEQRGSFKVQ